MDHVVDFSDVPNDGTSDGNEAPARRGRPRAQETISRDEKVLVALTNEPKTKNVLVEELGMKPSAVYLSLYRLRRDGHVEKVNEHGVDRHLWRRVD
jgi:predicted Rossmann fold nucleotide-binding protein DprA/Smf involved in DNA uptake